ncbi:MAG TPA: bifunctional precorrin-2 dehydrogenase/sirohydrochlorin ferrochelatase [Actinomycetota bacterium]|nr:bifunctional precorrin-2 dehydrogenase/sirohydrochlorin ferrochelatase [Actinomycetota bacterium]
MFETDLYIACLHLTGSRCLVVGAGETAIEKIDALLACGATVEVVAPETERAILDLVKAKAIRWKPRRYQPADLDGCLLVVVATPDAQVNEAVHADATARPMLINVVDVPALCNFILPAIVRHGPIAIAISTAGASPALAARMKREIAGEFGPAHARLAIALNDLREWSQANLPTYGARKEFFEDVVNGDPDPLDFVRKDDERGLAQLFEAAKEKAMHSLL